MNECDGCGESFHEDEFEHCEECAEDYCRNCLDDPKMHDCEDGGSDGEDEEDEEEED